MGCWNQTCAVTNLPILDTDDVVLLILKHNDHQNEKSCDGQHYHTPFPFTFEGKYNDYGAAEECHGVALEIIMDTIREDLYEMEEGENSHHDIPVSKEKFNIEYFFLLNHKYRLSVTNRRNFMDKRDFVRLTPLFIRKTVFDTIVRDFTMDKYNRETETMDVLDYDFFMKDCEKYTKDIDQLIALEPSDDMSEEAAMLVRFEKLRWIMDGNIGDSSVARLVAFNGLSMYNMKFPLDTISILVELREAKDERYEGVLKNAVRTALFILFMDQARKAWHIPSGFGSQDSETNTQELIADLTKSEIKTINERWDDYDE